MAFRVPVTLLSDEERVEIERRIRRERVIANERRERRRRSGEGERGDGGSGMTLREAMQQSAQLTLEYQQSDENIRKRMPDGAIRCAEVNENESENDDFIFPRRESVAMNSQINNHTFFNPKPASENKTTSSTTIRKTIEEIKEAQPRLPRPNIDATCAQCGWKGTRYRCSVCHVAR